MPIKPKVIETLDDFRKDVLSREKDLMVLMAQRWSDVEKALVPQIDALAQDIDALRAAGKDVSAGKLYRMERYKALLMQARNETAQFEAWAGWQIEAGQREYFEIGNAAAQSLLRDLLPAGLNLDFNRLPVDAVNTMVGFCKDGAPLFSVLKQRALFPEAVDGLTSQLINAMALGWNPTKTARAMADGLAAGLTKALVIARTEQLRAFREASFQNYNKNSDIVKGWVWHSACDARTCCACFAMHGSEHPLDERLADHVCGRCAMVPRTKSWKELGYDAADTNPVIPSGEEEFSKLSEEKQRAIMGNGRFELWKAGKLEFGKMATFTNDPVWGRSVKVASLKELKSDLPIDPIIGVSPYHSGRWGKLDAEGALNFVSQYGEKAKQNFLGILNQYGVEDDVTVTLGVWDAPEGSLIAIVTGKPSAVRKAAAEFGNVHDQDSVAILWLDKDGKDLRHIWSLDKPLSRKETVKLIDDLAGRPSGKRLFFTVRTDEQGRMTGLEHWGEESDDKEALDTYLRKALENNVNYSGEMGYRLEFINRENKPNYVDVLGDKSLEKRGDRLPDYE